MITHPFRTALAAIAICCGPALGETHRVARAAQAAPIADDTTIVSYVVDSVRVIQRLNPSTDVVAVNIYLLGGARQLTPATQGIEQLLLSASRYGTRSYPDTLWRAAWSALGSSLETDVTKDWTMLGFRGLRESFDRSWDLVTERLTAPTLRADGIAVARTRMLATLRQMRSSPEGEAAWVADSVVFAGHPYALSPYGTEANLGAIDSAAVAAYQRREVRRSRLLVVVAGAATRATVEAAVRRTLGTLPVGQYTWTRPTPLARKAGSLTMIPRATSTNYVIGMFDAPPTSSDEFPSYRAAMGLLGQFITKAVREKRGLSYAANASAQERALATGMIYVSTAQPDTVLKLIRAQIAVLSNRDSMPAGYSFTTDNNSIDVVSRRLTSASQVEALASAELLLGDYRLAESLPRRMRTVSTQSIRQAIQKYVRDIQFVYTGDTTKVSRRSFEKF